MKSKLFLSMSLLTAFCSMQAGYTTYDPNSVIYQVEAAQLLEKELHQAKLAKLQKEKLAELTVLSNKFKRLFTTVSRTGKAGVFAAMCGYLGGNLYNDAVAAKAAEQAANAAATEAVAQALAEQVAKADRVLSAQVKAYEQLELKEQVKAGVALANRTVGQRVMGVVNTLKTQAGHHYKAASNKTATAYKAAANKTATAYKAAAQKAAMVCTKENMTQKMSEVQAAAVKGYGNAKDMAVKHPYYASAVVATALVVVGAIVYKKYNTSSNVEQDEVQEEEYNIQLNA